MARGVAQGESTCLKCVSCFEVFAYFFTLKSIFKNVSNQNYHYRKVFLLHNPCGCHQNGQFTELQETVLVLSRVIWAQMGLKLIVKQ